jgi:sugar/nucleoside kinase (ribokinase family)
VVGSIAFDTIETPFGKVEDALGGSATYFGLAARLFDKVRLVGVVGEDFPDKYRRVFSERGIDIEGLSVARGRTFRWTGAYTGAMNEAETLAVELNVFGEFNPEIPAAYRDSEYVFLANGSPRVQQAVRRQVPGAKLVVCDTMNFYIQNAREELKGLIAEVDGLVLNDQEARMLTGSDILVEAGRRIIGMGPEFVVIKKGEHGALLIAGEERFALPAYPTGEVKDPTGAGDSFAGGMMGYLASSGDVSFAGLKRALAYGTAVASITVEGFGTGAIEAATRADVEDRVKRLEEMLRF